MDIYQSTVDYISKLPLLQSWPDLQVILASAASTKSKQWELPVIACLAVGGSVRQAVPAVAALACAQISIILIDDMLDDDPRGEYHRIGAGRAANFASTLQAASLDAFALSDIPPAVKLAAQQSINRMILTTTYGQDLDIQNPPDEAAYWHIVENKSAPFFGAALHIGALLGNASDEAAAGLEKLGRLYGEMIQIHDDLNDTMATPANPDWVQGRSPLPILFAQLVDHPEQARFLELCRNISTPEALSDAQDILVRSGAVSYCVDQLLHRYQAAREMLDAIPLVERDLLDALLLEVIAPVQQLFQEMGQTLPAFDCAGTSNGVMIPN